jgi:hypothetical protein
MQILSIDDLVKMLGLRPRTVRKLLRDGVIPGKKIVRRWYVTEDALKDVIAAEKVVRFPRFKSLPPFLDSSAGRQ